MYLIDTINYQIISNILIEFNIFSIIKLMNGNILIGCEYNNNNSLIEYKCDKGKLIKIKSKESIHSNWISGLVEMNDKVIISCFLIAPLNFMFHN